MPSNLQKLMLSSRRVYVVFFLGLVLISHLMLPILNDGKDWYLFSTWKLYAISKPPIDISWDDGRTFLFRDHRVAARAAGINIYSLFFHLDPKNVNLIRDKYKSQILKLCNCEDLKLIQFKGTLFDHIVGKKPLAITAKQKI